MTQTIEQLQARVRELEAENAKLKAESRDACFGLNDYYKDQLAAAQAECEFQRNAHKQAEELMLEQSTQLAAEQLNNTLLRDALTTCVCAMQDYQAGIGITEMFDKGEQLGRKALATPSSTEALDKYVAEKVKEAVKEADDQILAAKNLLAIMHRDGGHHEFAVGFDQAIQDAMAVYYELTQQRHLAVEALHYCVKQVPELATVPGIATAIKESEAK